MGDWIELKRGMKFKEQEGGNIYELGGSGVRCVSGEYLVMWGLTNLTREGWYMSDVSEENIHKLIIEDRWKPAGNIFLTSTRFEELQKSNSQKRFEATLRKTLFDMGF